MTQTTNEDRVAHSWKALRLLSFGTFLEYFDKMLYIHMAVLLNDLFFPTANSFLKSIIVAATFASTYLLNPVGAWFFGRIADQEGRKKIILITICMTSITCLTMAFIPTYKEIGVWASVIVIICRLVQGVAAMGEGTGADLYILETTPRPSVFLFTGLLTASTTLGSLSALLISKIATNDGLFNWRYAFFIGAIIAFFGLQARLALKETIDFGNAKIKLQSFSDEHKNLSNDNKLNNKSKINTKTIMAWFGVGVFWPVIFYYAYGYSNQVLLKQFGYTQMQIINNSIIVALVQMLNNVMLSCLGLKIYPLKILKFKCVVFLLFSFTFPYILSHATSGTTILLLQLAMICFWPSNNPATPIFLSYFPIFKRFTYTSIIHSLARIVGHIIPTFALVFIIEGFGVYGMLFIFPTFTILFYLAVKHYEELERLSGNYPQTAKDKLSPQSTSSLATQA
jgi:MHS family proline/betaine transporter-like MFS transporter